MEWKFRCKACGIVLDDATSVRNHWFFDHREAVRYADPVVVDQFDKFDIVEEEEVRQPAQKRRAEPEYEPVAPPRQRKTIVEELDDTENEEEAEVEPEPEPKFIRKKAAPLREDDAFEDLRL